MDFESSSERATPTFRQGNVASCLDETEEMIFELRLRTLYE